MPHSNTITATEDVSEPPIAVFDLDGTLLHGDSTGRWMTGLLLGSVLRASAATLIAPVACTMLLFPSLRKPGASAMLWVATAGMDESALNRSMQDFAARFASGQTKLAFKPAALAAFERHIAEGHRVVVVTAAPRALAMALLSRWAPHVTVFGSSLKRKAWGWIADRHCRGDEKCRFMQENGYPSSWHFAYSDSDDDHPLLGRAKQAFLVNSSKKVAAALRRHGIATFEQVDW